MRNWIRHAAPLLLTVPLGLLTVSCVHSNRQVYEDDIPMTVRLRRGLVHDNARPAPSGSSDADVSVSLSASPSIGMSHTGHHHSNTAEAVGENLAVFFLVQLPMEIAFSIMVDSIADAKASKVEMWPKGYRKDYTQTLRWGRNKVWFPRALHRKMVPIVMRVSGGWEGEFIVNLAVVPDDEKTLRDRQLPD
jgi:hypothetical protein